MRTPRLLALLVCERIEVDERRCKSIIRSFREFSADYPCSCQLCVYVSLAGAQGDVPITIQIVDADEALEPVASATFDVPFSNPLEAADLDARFPSVTFPSPGMYLCRVSVGEEVIGETRLSARQVTR